MKQGYTNYFSRLLTLAFCFLVVVCFSMDAKGQTTKPPELLYFKFDNPNASGTISNQAKPTTRPVDKAQIVGNLNIGGTGQFGTGMQGPTDDNNKIFVNWKGKIQGDFSVSWWLNNYPPGNNTSHWGTPNGQNNFHLWFNNLGWPTIRYRGNYNYFYQPNSWSFPVTIHIVYDDSKNEVTYYRNGKQVQTASWNTGGSIDVDGWQVGHGSTNGGGIPSGAILDEFRLYSRALSAKEVKNTYDQELFPVRTKPKAQFFPPDTVFPGLVNCIANRSERETAVQWYVDGQDRGNADTLAFEASTSQIGTKQTISLAVSNRIGSDSISKQVYVEKASTPNAQFKATKNIIDPSERTQLLDLSKNGPTSWEWTITPDSSRFTPNFLYPTRRLSCTQTNNNGPQARSPVLQFLLQGKYDVKMKAENRFGSDSLLKRDYLIVRDVVDNICGRDTSSFGYGRLYDNGGSNNEYTNGARCNFTIQSCGRIILSLEEFDLKPGDHLRIYDGGDTTGKPLWSRQRYGDTGLTGELGDVPNTFIAESGSAHIVFSSDFTGTAAGFNLTWKTQDKQIATPTASLSGPDTVCPGSRVSFKNNSQNRWADYSWDTAGLNTGGQVADTEDLLVAFPYAGTWDLSLIARNCTGADTVTKQVVVQQATQGPTVGFKASERQPVIAQPVELMDTSQGCASYYKWEFSGPVRYVRGDSNSMNPKVAFQRDGCYDVTLYAGNNQDTVSVTRQCYIDIQCTPFVRQLNDDVGISYVQLANLQNRSSIGKQGYVNNYLGNAAVIEAGETNKLIIKRRTQFNPIDLKVWIDIDGDNDFDRSDELFAQTQGNFQRYTTNIKLSDTLNRGDLRMRIGTNISGLPNKPCGPNRYGEFEDYRIRLIDDQTPPDITLRGSKVLSIGACDTLGLVDTGNFAVDNVDGRIANVKPVNSIDTSQSGTDTLIYRVSDSAGNTATAYRFVNIAPDMQAPQGTLKGPDTVMKPVSAGYRDSGYRGATDQCSGLSQIDTLNNIVSGELGLFTYSYRLTDQAGNSEMLQRYVRVVDTTSPTAQLAGNSPVRISLGGSFSDPGLQQVSDNYWSDSDITVTVSGQVNPGVLDTFTLLYRVTDGSGNQSRYQRQVIVEDRTAPSITSMSGGMADGDTVVVTVDDQLRVANQLSVSDNSNRNVTLTRQGSYFSILESDGTPGSLGVYEAVYAYSDRSGNTSEHQVWVEVVDRTAPEIALKGNKTVNIERWEETVYAKAFDSGATVTDNHYVDAKLIKDSSSYFTDYVAEGYPSSGVYELLYEARDSAGNVSQVTRFVSIESNTTGVGDAVNGKLGVRVNPNPTSGNFRVSLKLENPVRGSLSIINTSGQEVAVIREGQLNTNDYQVDFENQPAGVYFVKMKTDNGITMEKVVLTK